MSIRFRTWSIVLALAVLGSSLASAEISAQGNAILLAGITNGSDPVGVTIWQPLRALPASAFLNPGGEARRDGRPDIARDPLTGHTFVVWAYNAGTDHDIAVSNWDGESWQPTVFLTSAAEDEIDPRVFVEDNGVAHVVWWVAESNEVWATRSKTGSTKWKPPTMVADNGARPSLVVHDKDLLIAYEASVGSVNYVGVTNFSRSAVEVFHPTGRAERLDPVIHIAGGKLWIDYKASANEVGVMVLSESVEGGEVTTHQWTDRDPVSWPDPTWIGLESTRRSILRKVLQE